MSNGTSDGNAASGITKQSLQTDDEEDASTAHRRAVHESIDQILKAYRQNVPATEILGVSVGTDRDLIRLAYLSRSVLVHPQLNQYDGTQEAFLALTAAYLHLTTGSSWPYVADENEDADALQIFERAAAQASPKSAVSASSSFITSEDSDVSFAPVLIAVFVSISTALTLGILLSSPGEQHPVRNIAGSLCGFYGFMSSLRATDFSRSGNMQYILALAAILFNAGIGVLTVSVGQRMERTQETRTLGWFSAMDVHFDNMHCLDDFWFVGSPHTLQTTKRGLS